MTRALRWVRAVLGLVAAWQLLTLLPVLAWPFNPNVVDAGMLVIGIVKVIVLSVSIWAYDWLRTVIIERHSREHHTPHPFLSKSRWEL